MALVTAAIEKNHLITGFTAGESRSRWGINYGTAITQLNISPRMRMDTVLRNINNLPFGGTDCALPMVYALEKKLPIDAFIVYTDSETWAGDIQPVQALRNYRNQMGIPAKLVVVGMTATEFTIADPSDAGMMDVVGFDASAPNIMSDFIGVSDKK
jgi:60 kDa SS-A/Ro ribonucleoprotein